MKKLYGLLIISMIVIACTKVDITPSNPVKNVQVSAPDNKKPDANVSNSFRTYYFKHNKVSKGLLDSIPVIDSISVTDTTPIVIVPVIKICDTVQYIKFRSFWTADYGQANVYEIEAYSKGVNVALNKPVFATSTNDRPDLQDSIDDPSYGKVAHINDGNTQSRWSSDRNIDSNYNLSGRNDSIDYVDYVGINRAYIIIDLTQKQLIDSIRLYLFTTGVGADTTMWTVHKQTFGLYTSKDIVKWDSIGGGIKVNQLHW